MAIEKMQLVNIAGHISDLDRTIVKCMDSGCFHVENAAGTFDAENSGFVQLREDNPYRKTLDTLVSADFGGEVKFHEASCDDLAGETFEELAEYAQNVCSRVTELGDEITRTNEAAAQYEQILTQLKHLHGLDIDMEQLFRCKYIHVRFGKLPADSYVKLQYYGNENFIFVDYDSDDDFYWGMYFAPVANLKKADKIFSDLFFERIWVPDYLTGKPDKEISDVQQKYEESQKVLSGLVKERNEIISNEKEKLNKVFCRIKYLYDCFELRSKVSVLKDKFLMVGFVPDRQKDSFKDSFKPLSGVSVVMRPPDSEAGLKIPVKLKTNKFTNPFSMFIEMYGLPEYGDFNPINLVAITYTILFGIMFGDLGQGLVLAIAGTILYKKTGNKLCGIVSRIGVSSAFFGFLFGSVFGFEHLLDPVFKAVGFEEKPFEVMDNVTTILGSAIGIGVFLILISIIINIVSSLKKKEYDNAVFGNNGIIGLVFFAAVMYAAVSALLLGKNVFSPLYIILFIAAPLVIMMFREPLGCMMSGKKYKPESVGDFIAANFFEVFEFVLGYVTNTLSFVRIGGFVLSHAAMMSVVMLISEMYKGASPVIIVLGNIFVIAMEGMLSGIQVLRLEFYEIFSRCYDGDGKAFEPVSVRYDPELD